MSCSFVGSQQKPSNAMVKRLSVQLNMCFLSYFISGNSLYFFHLIRSTRTHDNDNDNFQAEEVVAFILAIEQHFYHHFRVKLSVSIKNWTFWCLPQLQLKIVSCYVAIYFVN